eukprot:NODE_51_length_27121_cov_0.309452.p16 type:complete len:128 gc:universal NODE_51_length_27121_cov_0.309452:19219-18836(-)
MSIYDEEVEMKYSELFPHYVECVSAPTLNDSDTGFKIRLGGLIGIFSSVLRMQPLSYAQIASRVINWVEEGLNQSNIESLWQRGLTTSNGNEITFGSFGITEINEVKISMIFRSIYYENGNHSEIFK